MKNTQQIIKQAAEQGIIDQLQAQQLNQLFAKQTGTVAAKFDFTHVLYYFGGLIAIGAMTLFMNLGWESFGGWGIVFISMFYGAVGLKLTQVFEGKGLLIPAGICATFVVALTPLAVYGLQEALGVWPVDAHYRDYHRYIQWHWLYMELSTLAAGLVVIWKYRYPFLTMPIAVTLWYLSMDLSAMLIGKRPDYELWALVSMYFGLLVTLLAFWVDIRSRKTADFAFWLYLFGVIAFWGGLSSQESTNELAKLGYFSINLLLIGVGVLLARRVFVVFGALGSAGYIGYLAVDLFADSWLFPVVLTVLGLGIIYLGVLWQKHEKGITEKARKMLPAELNELLASRD